MDFNVKLEPLDEEHVSYTLASEDDKLLNLLQKPLKMEYDELLLEEEETEQPVNIQETIENNSNNVKANFTIEIENDTESSNFNQHTVEYIKQEFSEEESLSYDAVSEYQSDQKFVIKNEADGQSFKNCQPLGLKNITENNFFKDETGEDVEIRIFIDESIEDMNEQTQNDKQNELYGQIEIKDEFAITQNKIKMHAKNTNNNVEDSLPQNTNNDDKDNLPQICIYCNQVFPNKHFLQTHIIGRHKKYYKCQICQTYLSSKSNLQLHTIAVHSRANGKKWLKCKFCKKSFSNELRLKNHVNDNHVKKFIYKCNHCSADFLNRIEYETHIVAFHLNNDISIFSCVICEKMYLNKNDLKIHVKDTHGNLLPVKKDILCKCRFCEKVFFNPTVLKIHQQIKHLMKDLLQCNICYKFYSKHKLETHVIEMHLKKKFHFQKCNICNKFFSNKNFLNVHMDTVHLQKK